MPAPQPASQSAPLELPEPPLPELGAPELPLAPEDDPLAPPEPPLLPEGDPLAPPESPLFAEDAPLVLPEFPLLPERPPVDTPELVPLETPPPELALLSSTDASAPPAGVVLPPHREPSTSNAASRPVARGDFEREKVTETLQDLIGRGARHDPIRTVLLRRGLRSWPSEH
jgi:hypothetical protein